MMFKILSVSFPSHLSLVKSLTGFLHVTSTFSPIAVFLISPVMLNMFGLSVNLAIDSLVHVMLAEIN